MSAMTPANRPAEATQGPWKVEVEDGDEWWFGGSSGPYDKQAVIRPVNGKSYDSIMVGPGNTAEELANAALIASAPEMAERLASLLAQADAARGLVEAARVADIFLSENPMAIAGDPLDDQQEQVIVQLRDALAACAAAAPGGDGVMAYAQLKAQLVTRRKRAVCLKCRKYVEPGQRAYVVRPPDGGPAVVWHEACDKPAPASTEGQQDA